MFEINDRLENLVNEENNNLKRNIIIGLIIGIILITDIIVIVIFSKQNDEDDLPDVFIEYKQNTFFFFDPVTNKPCNESNYWTPFDQSTTCYRFVSITNNDTNETCEIKIMLDHNIGKSNYTNYINILNNKTSNWLRYRNKYTIDIVDEETIFNIMKFKSKPNKTTKSVNPGLRVYYYSSNSDYIINENITNERGYWTKDKYDENNSYAINKNGNNIIISKKTELGVRPVLKIKKSLLKIDSGLINITDIIKNATKINIKRETITYDGFKYGGLQGITVTNDKLIFMSANNNNPTKSVMYSYKLNDFNNMYKKDYNNTAHGNGMTYNSKTDKVLVAVNSNGSTIYEYNGKTLIREKEHNTTSFPSSGGIGYDYNNDLYVGRSTPYFFLFDRQKMVKLFQFSGFMFETAQDLEYYNGYIFDCNSDGGVKINYQSYSFYKGYEIIYVYDIKLDKNRNPTKNFGRLIARLSIINLGELESISFRDGYVYIGFSNNGYIFYKIEYDKFAKEIKKIK